MVFGQLTDVVGSCLSDPGMTGYGVDNFLAGRGPNHLSRNFTVDRWKVGRAFVEMIEALDLNSPLGEGVLQLGHAGVPSSAQIDGFGLVHRLPNTQCDIT